jgi:hypothetical protein
VDVGWALTDAEAVAGDVENRAGDVRVHFLVTLIF